MMGSVAFGRTLNYHSSLHLHLHPQARRSWFAAYIRPITRPRDVLFLVGHPLAERPCRWSVERNAVEGAWKGKQALPKSFLNKY